MYTLLLLLIYMAFISLGLPDSLLGSAWPIMHEAFSVPLSYAGLVTMIISAGTICSSLMSERLTKKFGTQIVTVCSVLLTAAALFGFSTSSAFYMLCLWAIPYGLGAGAIDVALNNYVALHYSSKHMSWLHCFWGVGTIISPYIMSYALTTSSWQNGYRMVSFLQMGITMILFVTLPVWKVNKTAEQQEEQHEVIGIRGAVKIKGVPQLLLGFFSYCALESTLILWSSSYLVGAKGISAERAAVLLPIPSDTAALAGLVVMGIGCAPVYPSIIHATPANFGEKNSQAIIGIQMASAYVGSTFMPPVFGLIANHISITLLPVYVLIFIVLMFFMVEKTFRLVR